MASFGLVALSRERWEVWILILARSLFYLTTKHLIKAEAA